MNTNETIWVGGGYPFRKEVTTTTYNYLSLSEDAETVRLGRAASVQNIVWRYHGTAPESIDVWEKNVVEDCLVAASGITAETVSVAGGGIAENVTCGELLVGFTEDYSTLTTFYFSEDGGNPYSVTTDYSDFSYSFGSAQGCTVNGTLHATAGVVSDCRVNGTLRAEGTPSFDAQGDGSGVMYFSPEVRGCTIDGTLLVGYGAAVSSAVLVGGKAVIGSEKAVVSPTADDEKSVSAYGKAVVTNLVVKDGDVTVNYGGRLSGAEIGGALIATNGAELSGVISCESLYLEHLASSTAAITVTVDLNDYALPVQTRTETIGEISVTTEYFADLHKKTTTRNLATGVETVVCSAFDPATENLDTGDWRSVFAVDLGSIGDYALTGASDIVIDFGDSLANFAEGTITISGEVDGGAPPLRFKTKGEKFALKVEEDGDWFTGYEYNSELYGYGYEVLWLENGTEEAEYVIELPDDCLGGADQNVSIQARDENGVIMDGAALPSESFESNRLVVSQIDSNDLVIEAEEADGRRHQCDLELWVVPEVISGLDKAATGRFAELLRASQGNIYNCSCTWNNIHTQLLGIGFDLTNMGVSFTVTAERTASLKMQGKLEWAISDQRGGTGTNTKLVLDLSGDNYIAIRMPWKQNAVLDVVGTMTCPDFKIGKFGFSGVSVSLDTVANSWQVGAYVTLPFLSYAFGGEIGVVDGCWDSFALGVGNLNIPLGATGLMLQNISGSVKDMSTSLDMTFGGTLGLTYGPVIPIDDLPTWLGIDDGDYALCALTVTAEISTDGTMTGSADLTCLGNLISGSGKVSAGADYFSLTGEFGMLNNCISVRGEFSSGSGGTCIAGTGRVQVPAEAVFGMLAGKGFTINAHADFDGRYVLAWHESTLFGNSVSLGFRCSFDGDVELLGTTSIAVFNSLRTSASQTRSVTSVQTDFELAGDGVVFFQCTVTEGAFSIALTDGSGRRYTQAQIQSGQVANMQIVRDLCTDTCMTVAVDQPGGGIWTMTAYDNLTAVMTASSLLENPLAPVVTGVTVGSDGRTVTLDYSLCEALDGLADVKVSVFCTMPGAETQCLAQIQPATGGGSFTWTLSDEIPGGSYSFYLLAEADGLAPVASVATTACQLAGLDTDTPDAIAKATSQWSSTGTIVSWEQPYDNVGVSEYLLRYGTDAENLAEIRLQANSYVFDAVANGSYYWQVAAIDAAGNCSSWTELQECRVNLKANADFKNEILAEATTLSAGMGAVAVDASALLIAEAGALVADSVVQNAKIYGNAENLTVNGSVLLEAGGKISGGTVNGELLVAADGAACDVTVAGGTLSVGNRGSISGITLASGASLVLSQGSEFQDIRLAQGARLTIAGSADVTSNRFLLSDDLAVSGEVTLERYLYGNGHHLYLDVGNGHVNDMSRIVGDALVLTADTLSAGSYLVSAGIASFSRALTVQCGTASISADFGQFSIIGDKGYRLRQAENALYLEVADMELAAPEIHISCHDLDTTDYFLIDFDSMAANSTKCRYRYAQSADMSDATVSVAREFSGGTVITVGKEAFDTGVACYLQACTQDANDNWSAWSDAVQFTVTQKYTPLQPVVSGASLGSAENVTLTVSEDERTASKYTFRYADNEQMLDAVVLYDYGTNEAVISKSVLQVGKTYYAQVYLADYGWGQTAAFAIADEPDYRNYTITGQDGYFTVGSGETGVNLIVAADDSAWCAVSGTVDGLTVLGGFVRLDSGCAVTDMAVAGGKVWLESGAVSGLTIQKDATVRLMETVIDGAVVAGTLNPDYNTTTPVLTGDILVQGTILTDVGALAAQADFVFDIGSHEGDKDTPYIHTLSVLSGGSTYSLLLDDTPEIGDYLLTWNEYADEIEFTLLDGNREALSSLTAFDEPLLHDGLYYSIVNDDARTFLRIASEPSPAGSDKIQLSWENEDNLSSIVQLSADGFKTVLETSVCAQAVTLYNLEARKHTWRVKLQEYPDWVDQGTILGKQNEQPSVIAAEEDAVEDMMFAASHAVWESGYMARHAGSIGSGGTGEIALLSGKNRIADVFRGAADTTVLYLTDDDNGDALFVDDIYTELPGTLVDQQARIAQLDVIQAGAGDDIVDLTSQTVEYVGDGVTIHGGLGNDTLWANKGSNALFGDDGNDRLVGAAGDDLLVGGSGNDSIHGGGGDDIVCFCENWGHDTVEQFAGGRITLWFAWGDAANWDEDTQTYSDGENCVTVTGIAGADVALKFGDDGSVQYDWLLSSGAFDETTSGRIFEESRQGSLA